MINNELFDIRERLNTAPCVPAIRNAVAAWKASKYKGVTKTTRELLNYWFHTDHKKHDGSVFRYYDFSRKPLKH